MPYQEFELNTEDDFQLWTREWQPEKGLKAAICLIHGLGEHGERYAHVAHFLNRIGCALLAVDLRGHGKSDGKRGHITSYNSLMNDIACFLQKAGSRYSNCPLFLYGHSMGGNLVLNFALRRKLRLSGVIASAPMLRTAFELPLWRVILGKTVRHIWPAMPLSSGLNIDDLSRDPMVVRAYRDDPMVHDRVTARFVDVLGAGEWAREHAKDFSVPLLLMHGGADRVTSSHASVDFASRAGSNCTLRIWKGLYHEIHNEPEKEQVLGYTAEWLASKW